MIGTNNIIVFYKGISNLRRVIILEFTAKLHEDSPSMLNRWNKHFCQLLNVHVGIDVAQTETHTAESLVSEYGALDAEMTIDNFKRYKLQVLTKLQHVIQAEGNIFDFLFSLIGSTSLQYQLRGNLLPVQWFIKWLILFKIRKDYLKCCRLLVIYQFIIQKWNKLRQCWETSLLLTTYKNFSHIILSRFSSCVDETAADRQCGFRRSRPTIDHVFCLFHTLEKNRNKMGQSMSYQSLLFTCDWGLVWHSRWVWYFRAASQPA